MTIRPESAAVQPALAAAAPEPAGASSSAPQPRAPAGLSIAEDLGHGVSLYAGDCRRARLPPDARSAVADRRAHGRPVAGLFGVGSAPMTFPSRLNGNDAPAQRSYEDACLHYLACVFQLGMELISSNVARRERAIADIQDAAAAIFSARREVRRP